MLTTFIWFKTIIISINLSKYVTVIKKLTFKIGNFPKYKLCLQYQKKEHSLKYIKDYC